MKTIKLNDSIYKELHIVDVIEYSKNQYKGVDISDNSIKFAFLTGYGTTLFFENMHYLIVDSKKPIKCYAIWRNHNVIGYCYINPETADKANKAKNAIFYFGSDEVSKMANNEDKKND